MNTVAKFSAIELALRMENNSISEFRLLDGFSWADLIENQERTEFVSGLPIPWMNILFRTIARGAEFEKLVLQILTRCEEKMCPMLWKVSALGVERLEQTRILEAHGFNRTGTEIAMILNPHKFLPREEFSEIKIRRVCDYAGMKDWLIPYASAFKIPQAQLKYFERLMISKYILSSEKENWFVAYWKGKPVATVSSLFDNDISMIYNVSTLANFEGRGFGRRITQAAIEHAFDCSRNPIGVYSTTQAFPLFRNMGFEELHDIEDYTFLPKSLLLNPFSLGNDFAIPGKSASNPLVNKFF